MEKIKVIEDYQKDALAVEKKHAEAIDKAIKIELAKFEKDSEIDVSGGNCDGAGIATGTYADAFNKIDTDGKVLIYNNNDCQGTLAYGEEKMTFDHLSNDTKCELLKSLISSVAKERLEYLRIELQKERISYEEIAELQSLRIYIKHNDVELLEAAGVPES